MEFTKEQMSKALNESYKKAGHNAYFANGFKAGIEFALKWYSVDDIEDLPDDENVLVKSNDNKFGVYKGWMIKAKQLDKITYWRPIQINGCGTDDTHC